MAKPPPEHEYRESIHPRKLPWNVSYTVVLALSATIGAGLVIGGTCATEVIRLIRTLAHAFGA